MKNSDLYEASLKEEGLVIFEADSHFILNQDQYDQIKKFLWDNYNIEASDQDLLMFLEGEEYWTGPMEDATAQEIATEFANLATEFNTPY